MTAGQVY